MKDFPFKNARPHAHNFLFGPFFEIHSRSRRTKLDDEKVFCAGLCVGRILVIRFILICLYRIIVGRIITGFEQYSLYAGRSVRY